MKQLTTHALLHLAACMLAIGCTKPKGAGNISQKEELDELKAQAKSAEVRLAVAKKDAQHAFQVGLGELRFYLDSVTFKVLLTAALFEIDSPTCLETTDFEGLNKLLQKALYLEGDKKKEQGATGALAAFFYPLTDAFIIDEADTDSQLYVSLTRIILQCKEALAALVEQPENYTSNKVDEILAEHQQKMTQAPELAIDTSDSKPVLRKSGDSPQDYYQAPGVQQAYEAFKTEVKKLQKNYEIVQGL